MRKIDFSKFCDWEPNQVTSDTVGYKKFLIDMTVDYPPIDYFLEYNGVGCVPRGELQAVTGKMKTGKSFACMVVEVALLKGECMGIVAKSHNLKVLHVDTEQGEGNIVDRAKTLHSMCGWATKINNDRFAVLTLRECDYKERLKLITDAIEDIKPDFVLIDGVRDLCADFNDIGESSSLIEDLTKIANKYKVAVMCVLHENKGDTNMRGHLGTELGHKGTDVYKVSKKDGVITVEQTAYRNAPIDKWSFTIGDGGVPQQQSTLKAVNKTKQKRDNVFREIFHGQNCGYTHTVLAGKFMELYHCEKRCATGHIDDALQEGLLCHESNLYYYIFPPAEDDLF